MHKLHFVSAFRKPCGLNQEGAAQTATLNSVAAQILQQKMKTIQMVSQLKQRAAEKDCTQRSNATDIWTILELFILFCFDQIRFYTQCE